jgi:hypothetical protein
MQIGFWSWISWPCFDHWFVGGYREMLFPIAGLIFPRTLTHKQCLCPFFWCRRQWTQHLVLWLACLLLCAHLDKMKAVIPYNFPRCTEDKHLNCQVSLHSRGGEIASRKVGQTDKRRQCGWVLPLSFSDSHMKAWGQGGAKTGGSWLNQLFWLEILGSCS